LRPRKSGAWCTTFMFPSVIYAPLFPDNGEWGIPKSKLTTHFNVTLIYGLDNLADDTLFIGRFLIYVTDRRIKRLPNYPVLLSLPLPVFRFVQIRSRSLPYWYLVPCYVNLFLLLLITGRSANIIRLVARFFNVDGELISLIETVSHQ